MDINDLRGISTGFLLVSFIGLIVWAWGKKQKPQFDEAADLPFADDDLNNRTMDEVKNRD